MTTRSVRGLVKTVTTHLEMFAPPKTAPLQPTVDGIEIVRALRPTVSFYRYLYNGVGEEWLWTGRRLMEDEDLRSVITASTTDLRVLWRLGVPAGFAEFDTSDSENVELTYFGLLPEFIGLGLGRYFIDWTVRHAFTKGAGRLYVHTCDLDHPRALANYEAAGFTAFDREERMEPLLEGMPLPQHAADRPITPV